MFSSQLVLDLLMSRSLNSNINFIWRYFRHNTSTSIGIVSSSIVSLCLLRLCSPPVPYFDIAIQTDTQWDKQEGTTTTYDYQDNSEVGRFHSHYFVYGCYYRIHRFGGRHINDRVIKGVRAICDVFRACKADLFICHVIHLVVASEKVISQEPKIQIKRCFLYYLDITIEVGAWSLGEIKFRSHIVQHRSIQSHEIECESWISRVSRPSATLAIKEALVSVAVMILLYFSYNRAVFTWRNVGQWCTRIKDHMLRLSQSNFSRSNKHSSEGYLPVVTWS